MKSAYTRKPRPDTTTPAPTTRTAPPEDLDGAEVGGDELRARAYLKGALGETDHLAPAGWQHSPPARSRHPWPPTVEVHHHHYGPLDQHHTTSAKAARRPRTFDFSWITADKARITAWTAAVASQAPLYSLAGSAGRTVPMGLLFMTCLLTGWWRLSRPGPLTRWLFTCNLTAFLLCLPTLLLLTTVLTGEA